MRIIQDKTIYPVNCGRLRKMCKYFRGKTVRLMYEYNNSMGHHSKHDYCGVYDEFELHTEKFCNYIECYTLRFFNKGKQVFEVCIENGGEFYGLGKIRILNSGPYCYFSISRRNTLFQKFFP